MQAVLATIRPEMLCRSKDMTVKVFRAMASSWYIFVFRTNVENWALVGACNRSAT